MFDKVLIANRGEIACRIARTLRRMQIGVVAVYSEADRDALHVRAAHEAVCIGPAAVAQSYLRAERLIEAALETGARAIHPGYGFLSENAGFAALCERSGITFIGPTAAQIRSFGLKHEARAIAKRTGTPLLPGTGLLESLEAAEQAAFEIGYPVMLKSTAGGGGIGLRVCNDAAELGAAFDSVRRLGGSHFDDGGVFLEKFLQSARHIEVQIFGDGCGRVLALGERDCSAQRRNQKLVEEAPAPGLAPSTRQALLDCAVRLGQEVEYSSAGTVEFVFDARTQDFYFLEVNTRLQVEHGVTEAVTGLDLVEWMVRHAAGELELPERAPEPHGHAIEVRLYSEDPHKDFQPSTGLLTHVAIPSAARWDGWVEAGTTITPHYDPLLAKIVVHGDSRQGALQRLRVALDETALAGIESNLAYLRQLAIDPAFAAGGITTRYLGEFAFQPRTIDVVDPGTQTTVQDYPGRVGYWAIGVPPSGPMDDFAFRVANRLVGNAAGAPALEFTITGPVLTFNAPTLIALTGAALGAELDGQPLPPWRAAWARAGSVLECGAVEGRGLRSYLAVHSGFQVPAYLGSASTFMLGGFGGHAGRALRAGDVLHLSADAPQPDALPGWSEFEPAPYPEVWDIAVLHGPHGSPDFFTPGDIEAFFAATWQVHYNSDRTGIRLIGPKPTWARKDGGEAGLHPSNIHDNAYAIGTIDFTGDMPVILGPDGPSLGGFVCPATVASAERWKLGQLKAGDRVRFHPIDEREADALRTEREQLFASRQPSGVMPPRRPAASGVVADRAIVAEVDSSAERPRLVFRRSGDEYLLVEFGALELDLSLRFSVHLLMNALQRRSLRGILDLTPGVRSLQIHYAPSVFSCDELVALVTAVQRDLPSPDEIEVPTRVVHLPLSWEDPATLLAIEKYMRVVRNDAPWCPSNIEFIRRINGLTSVDDVRRIVFDASYLVLGLGDVYLGAPVATPLDPRHRLVTTKYNPARTWTPENAVGIGGAYMCIYGMEGPGGYQFVGRTLQVWNTHHVTPHFERDKPWLLRFFDQIRFYPVEASELLAMRTGFPLGRVPLRIETENFDFAAYRAGLAREAASITAFRQMQGAAFLAERERWAERGQDLAPVDPVSEIQPNSADSGPAGAHAVRSPVAGNLWKLLVKAGERVARGGHVAVVEAMKTEIAVRATRAGRVHSLLLEPGSSVTPGQPIVWLEPEA